MVGLQPFSFGRIAMNRQEIKEIRINAESCDCDDKSGEFFERVFSLTLSLFIFSLLALILLGILKVALEF